MSASVAAPVEMDVRVRTFVCQLFGGRRRTAGEKARHGQQLEVLRWRAATITCTASTVVRRVSCRSTIAPAIGPNAAATR
jgi:hypothetical protein